MAGLDVEWFLDTTDESERTRIHGIAKAATLLRQREADYLAVRIINELGKAFP